MTKVKYRLIIDDQDVVFSNPVKGINFLKELEKYNPDSNIPAQDAALYEVNDEDQFCPVLYTSVEDIIRYLQTLR